VRTTISRSPSAPGSFSPGSRASSGALGACPPISAPTTRALRFAGFTLDVVARHLVTAEGVVVPLSGGEYELLRIFLSHPNHVLTRDQLMVLSKGREAEPFDRSIDLQVSRLRHRLGDDPADPQIIKTVRGQGYVLAVTVEMEPK